MSEHHCVICQTSIGPDYSGLCLGHMYDEQLAAFKAKKREAAIQGMVARGYTRERAEEVLGKVARALFGPGGRFAPDGDDR